MFGAFPAKAAARCLLSSSIACRACSARSRWYATSSVADVPATAVAVAALSVFMRLLVAWKQAAHSPESREQVRVASQRYNWSVAHSPAHSGSGNPLQTPNLSRVNRMPIRATCFRVASCPQSSHLAHSITASTMRSGCMHAHRNHSG